MSTGNREKVTTANPEDPSGRLVVSFVTTPCRLDVAIMFSGPGGKFSLEDDAGGAYPGGAGVVWRRKSLLNLPWQLFR